MNPLALVNSPPESLPRSNRSNSPFRYPGGKFYARRLILEEIPPHSVYAEPFCGGASVFFAKKTAQFSTLNDLDDELINTLRQIRDRVEDLIDWLAGIPATKQKHDFYKNHYQPTCGLSRAGRWFYLNRTSYSGIMRVENCYWGYGRKYSMRPGNWPPHLRTVSDRLQGVELTTLDFEDVIDALPNGCFAFIDPPYYAADQQKFYNCTFRICDHDRLAACLERNSERILFLLTYDDHPDVRARYEWVSEVHNRTWNYTISRTDDQKNGLKLKDGFSRGRGKGRELFIRNYHV
ncbi:MAG: DNA adenine methylase [Rhodobacteraceae bacterium]|nr:DNA adenine methylase [Paracoccaceae bacterium]